MKNQHKTTKNDEKSTKNDEKVKKTNKKHQETYLGKRNTKKTTKSFQSNGYRAGIEPPPNGVRSQLGVEK